MLQLFPSFSSKPSTRFLPGRKSNQVDEMTTTLLKEKPKKRTFRSALYSTSIDGFLSLPLITLKGHKRISFCTVSSSKRRPISRLASKIVLVGFMAAWFFAASPIKRSVSVNATYDGVVRFPWSLAMISTLPCWKTPTHEYVVPKSMPMALPFLWAPLLRDMIWNRHVDTMQQEEKSTGHRSNSRNSCVTVKRSLIGKSLWDVTQISSTEQRKKRMICSSAYTYLLTLFSIMKSKTHLSVFIDASRISTFLRSETCVQVSLASKKSSKKRFFSSFQILLGRKAILWKTTRKKRVD